MPSTVSKPKPKPSAKPKAAAKRSQRASYPQKLRPPERVRAQWARRGSEIGERGYSQRWGMFWKRVVLMLKERESWRDEDLDLVAEYVRRCRLAELHLHEAEAQPYVTNQQSGMVRPHGGWERSLAEAREARAVAIELKLTPRARHAAGIDVPGPEGSGGRSAGDVGRDGETGGWVDDQVGPDGEPL